MAMARGAYTSSAAPAGEDLRRRVVSRQEVSNGSATKPPNEVDDKKSRKVYLLSVLMESRNLANQPLTIAGDINPSSA